MNIERTNSIALVENKLPDGSRVLVDSQGESVYALNAIAGAAWDACQTPTDIASVTAKMERSLNCKVAEEVAEEAVSRLEEQQLVTIGGSSSPRSSRRRFMMQLGAAAVPLVVAMTLSEQRAYAQNAQSFNANHPDGDHWHHGHHHWTGWEPKGDPVPIVSEQPGWGSGRQLDPLDPKH